MTTQPFLQPEERRAGRQPMAVVFQSHVELLLAFLNRRPFIVGRIDALLSAQRTRIDEEATLGQRFEDCFFAADSVGSEQMRLRRQLEEAHWASGFRPRHLPGLHNGLVDPAALIVRACHLWRETRWPGRNGRISFAHTLFNLYVIRCLVLLAMRLWDAGPESAGARLVQLQGALDGLWETPSDQPRFVQDARWLIQLAQSPATDDLAAYFEVAAQIADGLPVADRIVVHTAGVRMAAGHLRSQLRHHSVQRGVGFDDRSLVVSSRSSNALDFALLVQELVPLLDAYEQAVLRDDRPARLDLADAVCQGLSPDPELFLNQLPLLAVYSMIEPLFVTSDAEGHAVLTPMGRRHVGLLEEYEARIDRVVSSLHEDCSHFRPQPGAYSPYGILYGFSIDLLEHMALRAALPEAVTRFGLEDVFTAGDAATGKLAWVSGWRKLPHLAPEVVRLFDYPQAFAEAVFERVTRELQHRVSNDDGHGAVGIGHLVIAPVAAPSDAPTSSLKDLPARYVRSSDRERVAAKRAESASESQIVTDRREGKYLVSYQTPEGWTGITKAVLTEELSAGLRVALVDVPAGPAAAMRLMYPRLIGARSD